MLFFHIASLYIVYRYMHCFFENTRANRTRELVSYGLYFVAEYLVDRMIDLPVINVTTSILFLYLLAQIYPGKQGKKLLSTFLIYGMNMFCEVATVFMLYDHKPDGEYGSEAFYIIVLFMFLCERIIEKFGIKNGTYDVIENTDKENNIPTYWDIGKVYQRIIIGISDSENDYINKMMEVLSSWIIEKIDNYNSSMYYENTSYILACYHEGRVL